VSAGFTRRDYYQILQVDASAHPEVLRAAYRTLLKALAKHPDLGGQDAEARVIIEAYETLGQPARRREYDRWLRTAAAPAAHPAASASPLRPASLAAHAAQWIRRALPEHRDAPAAPFASRFDLVLEAPTPSSDRLYVKAVPVLGREHWPNLFTLCRAVAVGRRGVLPSTDVVLFAVGQARDVKSFLAESLHYSAQWAWSRCLVSVCTLEPARVQWGRIVLVPAVLRRLAASL